MGGAADTSPVAPDGPGDSGDGDLAQFVSRGEKNRLRTRAGEWADFRPGFASLSEVCAGILAGSFAVRSDSGSVGGDAGAIRYGGRGAGYRSGGWEFEVRFHAGCDCAGFACSALPRCRSAEAVVDCGEYFSGRSRCRGGLRDCRPANSAGVAFNCCAAETGAVRGSRTEAGAIRIAMDAPQCAGRSHIFRCRRQTSFCSIRSAS